MSANQRKSAEELYQMHRRIDVEHGLGMPEGWFDDLLWSWCVAVAMRGPA